MRRSAQLWLIVSERLLENLLLRAEQIATAMDVRGFTSPNEHRVQWHQLRLRWRDWDGFRNFNSFLVLALVYGRDLLKGFALAFSY